MLEKIEIWDFRCTSDANSNNNSAENNAFPLCLIECLINEEFTIQSFKDEFGKNRYIIYYLDNHLFFTDAPSQDKIERWLATGDVANLENVVLDGRSHLLLDKDSVNVSTIEFLEGLTQYQAKIDAIHKAVEEGDVRRVKSLIDRIQLSTARDRHGMTPLHKALLYGQTNTVRYLLAKYPHCVNCTDHVSSFPIYFGSLSLINL